MKVKVRNNQVDKALRIFKRKCSETIFECREREYYEKPAEKRHKAKKSAIKREKRRQLKEKEKNGRK